MFLRRRAGLYRNRFGGSSSLIRFYEASKSRFTLRSLITSTNCLFIARVSSIHTHIYFNSRVFARAADFNSWASTSGELSWSKWSLLVSGDTFRGNFVSSMKPIFLKRTRSSSFFYLNQVFTFRLILGTNNSFSAINSHINCHVIQRRKYFTGIFFRHRG